MSKQIKNLSEDFIELNLRNSSSPLRTNSVNEMERANDFFNFLGQQQHVDIKIEYFFSRSDFKSIMNVFVAIFLAMLSIMKISRTSSTSKSKCQVLSEASALKHLLPS